MSKLVDDLLSLQGLMRAGSAASAEQTEQIERLRSRIPPPVLAHFLRQIANGRRGIAQVRNGVCGECHLRVSQSMAAMLRHASELLICESCGSFVTLAPEELRTPVPTTIPRVRRVKRLEPVA